MEFVSTGRVPSSKLFYCKTIHDSWSGETYEDFGFKQDCVVMTQEEYDELMKKIGNK